MKQKIKKAKARRSWPSINYLHRSNIKVINIAKTLATSITMLIVQLDLILDMIFYSLTKSRPVWIVIRPEYRPLKHLFLIEFHSRVLERTSLQGEECGLPKCFQLDISLCSPTLTHTFLIDLHVILNVPQKVGIVDYG